MLERHHVYLIPGLLGFSEIGGITYFRHVHELLEDWFRAAEAPVVIHNTATSPTASIRRRAACVFESIKSTAADEGPIHLIGHSTGGLDARLFVTPNAALEVAPPELEALSSRVQTVVTVATPNYGAPAAAFFSSAMGGQMLKMISLTTIYTMEYGKLPLSMLLAVGRVITRLDDLIGLRGSVVDQFYDELLGNFDRDKQIQIKSYLASVREDNAALGQLTPGGIDLLNAATEDRPGVRYGSVAMRARRPGWSTVRAIGWDPYRQGSHVLYRFLHGIGGDERAHYPTPTPQQAETLADAFGEVPTSGDTDGIVPTLSQLWGELVWAAEGDHLDVCGHFDDLQHDPPHYDWLATGSGFDRPSFESLWGAVTNFMLRPES